MGLRRAVVEPFLLADCQNAPKTTSAAGSPPAAGVSVIEVKLEDVPIYSGYAAQTFARGMVAVRGRVNGYPGSRWWMAVESR